MAEPGQQLRQQREGFGGDGLLDLITGLDPARGDRGGFLAGQEQGVILGSEPENAFAGLEVDVALGQDALRLAELGDEGLPLAGAKAELRLFLGPFFKGNYLI